ncbi:MAG: phospholipid/cholesterol/gamma-HCH transport system substrate-binding protein [Actinomycetota bacterium]|nr:phospholipid/cholesterol/gamma-HCH transport system substrate-binding protein [Actinomycetota bacterium]
MKRFRVAINLAEFGVLFAAMSFWAINHIVSFSQIDHPYKMSADFPNTFGVIKNAEVTYLGVNYGTITGSQRITGGVRVSMEVQEGHRIPRGSTANILRKSAIGEQYVDFEPPKGYPGTGGPYYQPGERVPMSLTTVPLEFSELLRSASNLIESVPPDAVATLMKEGSLALAGRAQSLRDLAQSGDTLSATLAQRSAALDRLATNNTRLTHVLTEHRGSLGQSLTDLKQVTESLKAAQANTSTVLDQGSQLLGQTANLVASQKGNLDCTLKDLELVTDETTTPRRLDELQALLQIGPPAFAGVWDSRDVETTGVFPGPWVRVGFVANSTHNPPFLYVPPKTLPAVQHGAACASPLSASGVSYRPASFSTGAAPILPATGSTGLLALGLALAGAALVIRLVEPTSQATTDQETP